MKPLLVKLGRCAAALCCCFSVMTSGAVFAQTTGTVDPNPIPGETVGKEDVPPGGCMPIGMTVSGEIVFPIQCKEFIERMRGKTDVQQSAAPEEKAAAKQSEVVAPENPKLADKPTETVALPERVDHQTRERVAKSDDCTHYRTYDPASGSYRGYDGRRRTCQRAWRK
jgi:hypothetical protein